MAILARFRRSRRLDPAHGLYRAAVEQARRPEFYQAHGVPDTLAGRFEMVALHVFLLLHRLKGERGAGAPLAQALFDVMFDDMDQALRELGTGDLSIGRHVKRLAEGFYGRIGAYDAGLEAADGRLAEALRRNVYATRDPAAGGLEPAAAARRLAAYARREAGALEGQPLARLLEGRVRFGPPPARCGPEDGADAPAAREPPPY